MSENLYDENFRRALRSEPFTAADRVFVRFLEETFQEGNSFVLSAAALCLAATREGHSYLDLSSPDTLPPPIANALDAEWPSIAVWQAIADRSPSIGSPEENSPLILIKGAYLYLRKHYEYERLLAASVVEKATESSTVEYSETDASEDLQKTAIAQALQNRLYVISGGPGTGKTTTVLGYITQAIRSHKGDRSLRIAAVAPTGKAAARLSESIRLGMGRLDLDAHLQKQLLDIPSMTVHRLLQGLPNQLSFRRNRKNPLEYDILVIDETSMIDLPLMQKLLEATPVATSMVLLGDHHQLTSVEVGSVFGDIARSALDPQSPLSGKSTTLTKTYRFSENSSIHRFCELCKFGNTNELESLLASSRDDFSFHTIESASRKALRPILDLIANAHKTRLEATDLESAYQSIGSFVALTPFNQGELGARSLNQLADAKIRRIQDADNAPLYQGMPLIILENNYDLDLFNGDIGIVWPDPSSSELFAWFSDSENGLKRVRLNWLPKHDFAYCLTIHKSQGSEFDHVAGIFSPEDNTFVSKELIYTCASRAKTKLTLFGERESLKTGIQRSVKRATRLEEQILEKAAR